MRLDLSSQISLERISQKYYRPANAFEDSALTRYEKIKTRIYESIQKGSSKAREKEQAFCFRTAWRSIASKCLYGTDTYAQRREGELQEHGGF